MSYFYNPVRAYFGKDGLENLHTLISTYGGVNKNILLITRGRDLKESMEYGKILSQLRNNTIHELDFTCSNPDISDVCDVIQRIGAFDYDIIIGVGGGSVLDISKAMAAFKGLSVIKPEEVRKLIANKTYAANPVACPWIGIPTTSGTGCIYRQSKYKSCICSSG